MEATSPVLLLKVMDGLALRMKAQAENVANAGTPHYRPLRVSFEEAVNAAATEGDAAVEAVRPALHHETPAGSNHQLRMDLELATSTKTAGRYGTLADLLNRELQVVELAITGERNG